MKKYYLKNGSKESGPFILDDLKYQRITENTLIRTDNGDWVKVSTDHNFSFLLSQGNDHTENANYSNQSVSPHELTSKKRIVLVMAIAIFTATLGMAVAFYLSFRNLF